MTYMTTWLAVAAFAVGCGGGGTAAEPTEPTPAPAVEPAPADDTAISNAPQPEPENKAIVYGAIRADDASYDEPCEEPADAPPVDPATYMPTAPATIDPALALSTGHQMCDLPYNRFVECIMTNPQFDQAMRDQMMAGLEQSRAALETAFAAATADTRDELAKTCETIASAFKQSATSLGCAW